VARQRSQGTEAPKGLTAKRMDYDQGIWILDFESKYYQNQKIPKNKIDQWINYITKALYKYQLRIAKDLLVII
jgi:hypothetical protein